MPVPRAGRPLFQHLLGFCRRMHMHAHISKCSVPLQGGQKPLCMLTALCAYAPSVFRIAAQPPSAHGWCGCSVPLHRFLGLEGSPQPLQNPSVLAVEAPFHRPKRARGPQELFSALVFCLHSVAAQARIHRARHAHHKSIELDLMALIMCVLRGPAGHGLGKVPAGPACTHICLHDTPLLKGIPLLLKGMQVV